MRVKRQGGGRGSYLLFLSAKGFAAVGSLSHPMGMGGDRMEEGEGAIGEPLATEGDIPWYDSVAASEDAPARGAMSLTQGCETAPDDA